MKKVYFVMEKPNSCKECKFRSLKHTDDDMWNECALTKKEIAYEDIYLDADTVSEYCPFMDFPERREQEFDVYYDKGYADGFNQCLDELKGVD